MKTLVLSLMAVAVAFSSGCCSCKKGTGADKPMGTSMAAPMHTAPTCYACPMCHELALEPGKCPKCGADMAAMRVLAVKDGTASLCACGADCKCTMPAEGLKCSCGKDITTVSLKGKYVCSGDGGCPMISDKPGKCACGKDLKLVE